jgi:hypothetical protein
MNRMDDKHIPYASPRADNRPLRPWLFAVSVFSATILPIGSWISGHMIAERLDDRLPSLAIFALFLFGVGTPVAAVALIARMFKQYSLAGWRRTVLQVSLILASIYVSTTAGFMAILLFFAP